MNFEIENNKNKKIEKRRQQKLLVFASIFFAVLSIILILVYFNTQNKTTTNTPEPKEETKKENNVEKEEEKVIDKKSNDRPLAVMIDNSQGDYKHAGLQDSYVNYEMISNDGETKILALFKDSEVEVIGPVTTLDHYFLDYAQEHKAVVFSYGMSEQAEKIANGENYEFINGKVDSNFFMQDKEATSHNIYTSVSRMKEALENKKFKTTTSNKVFNYSEEEVNLQDVEQSKKGTYINLKYSTNETREYKYDSNNKYYLRFNNGTPDIDRRTNEQLHYKNIIVVYIKNEILPRENILSVDTVGKGEGFYLTNGNIVDINWEKQSQNKITKYTYKDGKELKLNNGNTFIQIVPDNE